MKKIKQRQNLSLLAETQDAIRRISSQVQPGEWVVVVCPDGSGVLTLAASGNVYPEGASVSGRTAILSNKGRVSIVAVSQDVFIPKGTPFIIAFLGWGDDIAADRSRMSVWRERAARILT